VLEAHPRLIAFVRVTTAILLTLTLEACETQQAAIQQQYEQQQAATMEQINREAGVEMARIERQVVNDQIEQLKITVKHGSPMDICVQAGMVTAALLQAKDEAGYAEWKKLERKACKAAGLPQ
jgi:hypothetical protein